MDPKTDQTLEENILFQDMILSRQLYHNLLHKEVFGVI